ncbi:MAG: CapA family protein, partial [Candidatus Phosphoribacter sp.]
AALSVALLAACSGSSEVAAPATLTTATAAQPDSPAGAATPTLSAGSSATPSTPLTSTPLTATAPLQPGGRTVTVALTGDVLLHSGVTDQARKDAAANPAQASNGLDYRQILAGAKPVVEAADVAICNLETPVAPPGGPYTSYPVFSVPQEILPALVDTGFDACTTASNHTVDKGFDGLKRTLDAMDAAGLKHDGSSRSQAEAQTPTILDAKGVKVALLAYAYGLNGFSLPAGKPWAVDMIDVARILAEAKAARQAGAQIVLVALHSGAEYRVLPTDEQRKVATSLAASPDIDLVYGHHAHVVQPVDKIGDTWVIYGLGNMIANQHRLPELAKAQHQATAVVSFGAGTDGRFTVTGVEMRPTAMSNLNEARRYVDLATLLADPAVSDTRKAAYRALYNAAAKSLTALGAQGKGMVVAAP